MKRKKSYLKKDIKKYNKLNKKLNSENFNVDLLDVIYEVPFTNKTEVPSKVFSKILIEKRPDLIKYTPFKVVIKKLERGNNPWLKKTNRLGLYNATEKKLTLHVDLKAKKNILSYLWLLFHEFRHHVQIQKNSVLSCLDNENREMWLNHYDYTLNSVLHVFHEVDPIEVDANVFACEMLDIPYPNSKFSISKKTLKRLKPKK